MKGGARKRLGEGRWAGEWGERGGGCQIHRHTGRGRRQEGEIGGALGAQARVGVCPALVCGQHLPPKGPGECGAGESLSCLLNVINYSVALIKTSYSWARLTGFLLT